MRDSPSEGEPNSGRERILRAAYAVLAEGGYGELSIQRIADEADLSKATVYHHFEDKDDLMLSFLEFIASRIGERLTRLDVTEPVEQLHAVIDQIVIGRSPTEHSGLRTEEPMGVFIEVRARAVHDEEYRDRVGDVDRAIRSQIAEIIRDGIERGSIRDVDAQRAADTLVTLLFGALLRRTTTNDADLEPVRDDAYAFVDRRLRPRTDPE